MKKAWPILILLTIVNLFNYIDRNIFTGLAPVIQENFSLTDTQIGLLASSFLLVFMMICPIAGTLGDKGNRTPLLSISIIVWSACTALAGFAQGFYTMLIARSSVGVGEATFTTLGTPLIDDVVPKNWKAKALSFFSLSLPVGFGLGYFLSGYLNQHYGWRNSFFIVSIPGFILGLIFLLVHDPQKHKKISESSSASLKSKIKLCLQSRVFVLTTLGYSAYTFVIGGMSVWMIPILMRVKNLSHIDASIIMGKTIVVSGLLGTLSGGILADFFTKKSYRGAILVCAISVAISIPFAWGLLNLNERSLYEWSLLICGVFIFMCQGPINTVIFQSVPQDIRSTASGFCIFVIHILGDLLSPTLIGYLSDVYGIHAASNFLPYGLALASGIWFLTWKAQKAPA